MDALKSLVQPLVGGGGGSVIDGMKLVVLGGTVETARRMASSGCSCRPCVSFFLTAHFSEEDYPYDWLMLWLSRRPEWQRSREFETTTRTTSHGWGSGAADNSFGDDDEEEDEDAPGKVKTRVVFQPTTNTTHTIYYKGHWLRVKRGRKHDTGCDMLSVSVVARNNSILKQLVLQAKKEYEAEAVHRIQIYFADSHGCWRWTDSRHKRPMSSIVLNRGVKEMLLADTKDFLKSEKWYADRGIPFRRGYLLYGVPGSGKSSLIHAIAGELMLDIYVVSLSSSWINDSTLTTLMGRVPARCIVLLEDLDAAFTRSTSRDDASTGNPEGEKSTTTEPETHTHRSSSSRRHKEQLSDVNTLSLSGLLNALDGVAASEGRILFATTNHLERLDPALSRPGRMDVWVEFKNASKWQAELLFRNFFPSTDEDNVVIEGELEGIDLPTPPSPSAQSSSGFSSLFSSGSVPSTPVTSSASISTPPSPEGKAAGRAKASSVDNSMRNQAYLPPPVDDEIAQHSAKPLDGKTLARLAKTFADAIPEEEFSVAALQGYLLKNKSRPEAAADEAAAWVVSEREMRERLRKEREARELKEKVEREKRRKELLVKEKKEAELKKKEEEEVQRRLLEEKIRADERARIEAEKLLAEAVAEADKENDSPSEDGDANNGEDGKDAQAHEETSSNADAPMEATQIWVTVEGSQAHASD
ncbi:P-loop containing nucleoside triphosphate hydrolase protein [Daedalea quercina L-15889]|uniref:p-loop containing nucleoside triphosphate hydrolase protein n=1 Tax=Daedalea quercina L-15889 TaxID=1314783 RepID=A0A165S8H4_9APHY|nr:P-loop containing nucleoside triphosphate hydrolase protein [Daedalea quercina L-15889]